MLLRGLSRPTSHSVSSLPFLVSAPGTPAPGFSPSTTDSSQGVGGAERSARGWRFLQSLGDRRGRAREGSAAPAGEVREVITKLPPRQRFLISTKSKQGHIPKNKIFRSI